MKKNLMSVLIMALVLANLILTVILMISVVPQSKKANELITKVCTAIDLELQSSQEEGEINIPMDQIEEVVLGDGEQMTINLQSADGENHFVMMSVTIDLDTKHEDYTDATAISDKEGTIKSEINKIVSNHTVEDFREDTAGIQNEILSKLRNLYDSDFIVSVVFSDIQYQ